MYYGENAADLLKKIQDLGFDQSPWKERYPFIQNVMEDDPKLPLHNTVEGNVSIGSVWLQMHNSARQTSLHRINFRNNYVFTPPTSQKDRFPLNEDGSIRAEFREETLQFDDPEKDDFKALQAEVQKYVPDFKPIPSGSTYTTLFDSWTLTNFKVRNGICGQHTYSEITEAVNSSSLERYSLQSDGISGTPAQLWEMVGP